MSNAAQRELNMNAAMRYDQLSRHPHAQAEAIAQHYLSHLAIAKHMAQILSMARYDRSPSVTEAIEYEISLIKTNHAYDLGIKLEWPQLVHFSQIQDPTKF